MTTQYRTLKLPDDLCAQAETWMAGRFENLESLLIFFLQQIVHDDAGQLDQVDEQVVERRLRDLGYI